jgi:epoxyqueuosine reductase
VQLFAWTEEEFDRRLVGSAIRRIATSAGCATSRWRSQRATSSTVVDALAARREHPAALVREHVEWALARHRI